MEYMIYHEQEPVEGAGQIRKRSKDIKVQSKGRIFKLLPNFKYNLTKWMSCNVAVNALEYDMSGRKITSSYLDKNAEIYLSNGTKSMNSLAKNLYPRIGPCISTFPLILMDRYLVNSDESNLVYLDLHNGFIPSPETYVIKETFIKLMIDNAQTHPVIVVLDSGDPYGFTNRELFESIAVTYKWIYKLDQEAKEQKGSIFASKPPIPFGLYGNELKNIQIYGVNFNIRLNCITLDLT